MLDTLGLPESERVRDIVSSDVGEGFDGDFDGRDVETDALGEFLVWVKRTAALVREGDTDGTLRDTLGRVLEGLSDGVEDGSDEPEEVTVLD